MIILSVTRILLSGLGLLSVGAFVLRGFCPLGLLSDLPRDHMNRRGIVIVVIVRGILFSGFLFFKNPFGLLSYGALSCRALGVSLSLPREHMNKMGIVHLCHVRDHMHRRGLSILSVRRILFSGLGLLSIWAFVLGAFVLWLLFTIGAFL